MSNISPAGRLDVTLQAEAFAALIVSVVVYHRLFPHQWLFYAALFLVPDLTLIPYVKGPSGVHSILYNLAHTYFVPLAICAGAIFVKSQIGIQLSLIWIGHIGLDRSLGYGLKYPESFKFTHIQRAAYRFPEPQ